MRSNPIDKGAPKKAYATSQYSEVMNINQFAEHIASHGSVYKRSDVAAILTMAMTALGTDTSMEKFKQAGAKPFLLAGLLYIWLLGGGYLLTKWLVPMIG